MRSIQKITDTKVISSRHSMLRWLERRLETLLNLITKLRPKAKQQDDGFLRGEAFFEARVDDESNIQTSSVPSNSYVTLVVKRGGPSPSDPKSILSVPDEILHAIASHLRKGDARSLQQSCRTFYFLNNRRGAIHNSTLNICSLPDELLLFITGYLSAPHVLCLQRVSRRFFHFSALTPERGNDEELSTYQALLSQGRYLWWLQKEKEGAVHPTRRSCSFCKAIHRVTDFSDEQLQVSPPKRRCQLSDSKIIMCEHMSKTVSAISEDILEASEQHCGIFCGYYCGGEDHMHNSIYTDRQKPPSIEVTLPSTVGGRVQIRATHNFLLQLGLGSQTSDRGWRWRSIHGLLVKSNARMCEHRTANSNAILSAWTWDRVPRDKGGNSTRFGGACNEPGCTMRYWINFERGTWGPLGAPPTVVWLEVERARLSIPVPEARDEEEDELPPRPLSHTQALLNASSRKAGQQMLEALKRMDVSSGLSLSQPSAQLSYHQAAEGHRTSISSPADSEDEWSDESSDSHESDFEYTLELRPDLV